MVQLWLFYRSLRVLLLGDLWVLGARKSEAFLSWYAKVLEFQSCPKKLSQLGTQFTKLGKLSEMHH